MRKVPTESHPPDKDEGASTSTNTNDLIKLAMSHLHWSASRAAKATNAEITQKLKARGCEMQKAESTDAEADEKENAKMKERESEKEKERDKDKDKKPNWLADLLTIEKWKDEQKTDHAGERLTKWMAKARAILTLADDGDFDDLLVVPLCAQFWKDHGDLRGRSPKRPSSCATRFMETCRSTS